MKNISWKKVLGAVAGLGVAVFVGYKTYEFLKPEPVDEIEDLDDEEVDPSFDFMDEE